MKTDVLIVGGGLAGSATAYYLARAGASVTLIERGSLNARASGANAGSLHLQIPHAEYVALGPQWARAFAPVLPLMRASPWPCRGAGSGSSGALEKDMARSNGVARPGGTCGQSKIP